MILICIIGLVASLVPTIAFSDPFWGVGGFTDREIFAFQDSPGVVILNVESDSPALAAGLQAHDRVLMLNDQPVTFQNFRQKLRSVQTGEYVTLDVERNDKKIQLHSLGEKPAFEAVLVLDWQFITAPVFFILLLVSIATQPLDPPPLWRTILNLICGLAVLASVIIIEAFVWLPWQSIWRVRPYYHGYLPTLHYSLMAIVIILALAMIFLSTFGIRTRLQATK